jgi:serine protease Do
MERRFSTFIASTLLLGLGVFIGLTIHRLWFPPAGMVIPAAQAAATRQSSSTVAPPAAKSVSPVVQVVDDVSPAVVTVGAVKRRVVAQPWYDNFFFPSIRYQERFDRVPYMGSGFLIDSEGLVLTNFHVIEDATSLFVTFPNGEEFPAQLVDRDRFIDVALLRIDADGRTLPAPLQLGEADNLRIGEQVVAFGNPFGNLIEDNRPTITVGYISALHRSFKPDVRNQRVYQNMIQTDAAINPGNSGGPLVDMAGQVVGMNTFIFSTSGASAGIGFAIPAERLRAFVQEIRSHGRLRPLLLDFAYQTIASQRLRGIQVQGIIPGGPAEKAGLQVGDVVIEADGRPVMDRESFYVLFASKQVGDRVPLRIWRQGELVAIEYEVKEAKR